MKAAVLRGAGLLACEDLPYPELLPDGAILKVEACGICGSDLRIFKHGFRFEQAWQVLGHEIAGVLVEVGRQVTDYKVGDRLAVAADVHCKTCYYCQRGWFNLCENWQLIGTHYAGGMADYMALPPAILRRGIIHRMPDTLPAAHGALAEPASSVVASQAILNIEAGETVAILGDGPIGALQVQVARARGARPILIGRNDERLRLLQDRQIGAAAYFNVQQVNVVDAVRGMTEGRGADAAIVANPSKSSQVDALALVRKRGRVALFGGLPKDDPLTTLDSNRIHYDELSIIGTFSYHPDYHAQALEWIAAGKIEADKLITGVYPVTQVREAFAAVLERQHIKVMLTPDAAQSGEGRG